MLELSTQTLFFFLYITEKIVLLRQRSLVRDMQNGPGSFTRRRFLHTLSFSVLGAKALTRSLSAGADNMAKPNILFIMTDHQRADSIGMVQAGTQVAPNLDRLASQGTVFSRAYNTCPLCAPARTALATGKYPTNNGIVFNDWRGIRAGDHKPIHHGFQRMENNI